MDWKNLMPTYDYTCTKCSHVFEEFHGINEKVSINCPLCEGKTRRLISGGAGLIFKGTGFYITDYKRANSSFDSNKPSGDNNTNNTKETKKTTEKSETKEKAEKSSKKENS